MMSMNLAELGKVLCQEFDQREAELNTIYMDIRIKVKKDREELLKLRESDQANLKLAKKQVLEDIISILNNCHIERKAVAQSLKADRAVQVEEMNSWENERGEELKGWYEAGGCMFRKDTRR